MGNIKYGSIDASDYLWIILYVDIQETSAGNLWLRQKLTYGVNHSDDERNI
jgi:hypothetical protein